MTLPSFLRIFSLQLSSYSSLRLTAQIYLGCENPHIYFKNLFSFVFSQLIISEYANKFSRKWIPSTRFAKYLAWVWLRKRISAKIVRFRTRVIVWVLMQLKILTGKDWCLLNSVQEWLVGCFWPFWYVYTISLVLYILL